MTVLQQLSYLQFVFEKKHQKWLLIKSRQQRKQRKGGWHHQLDGRWVWASSRSWWWTEKPGVLQSMGSQRVGHDWPTDLNWTERKTNDKKKKKKLRISIWKNKDTSMTILLSLHKLWQNNITSTLKVFF